MRRATIGTWINYGTTLAFQIAFASRFGATGSAAAFVIAFSIMGGISGIVGSTVQTIAVPRLIDKEGAVRTSALRLLAVIACVICAAALALVLIAPLAARALVGGASRLDVDQMTSLLRLAGVTGALQLVAIEFGVVALARGHRFVPSVTPAIPSTVATAVMVATPGVGIVAVYVAFAIGLAAQIPIVASQALHRAAQSNEPLGRANGAVFAMLVSYALLAMIVPIDRYLAGAHQVADIAHYDYAVRSLAAVQRLILGGLMLSALADWSRLAATGDRGQVALSVAWSFLLVGLFLTLAASIAAVAGVDIVRIVYQRGRFTSTDTVIVATILKAALPGFAAEGLAMVLTQALASARHNFVLAAVGASHFAIRVCLAFALAIAFGAVGVAIAYSVTNVILLAALIWLTARSSLWPSTYAIPWRAVGVGSGTCAAAIVLAVIAPRLPSTVSCVVVVVVFATLYMALRPIQGLRLARR